MDRDAPSFDVIIAGGGLTGATLALALSRGGMRVALIDAALTAPHGDGDLDGRASAVALTSMKQWRALGLGDALISYAEPILSILVSDGSAPGARAAVAGRAPLSGLLHFDGADVAAAGPLGYMVENGRIREALRGGLIPAKVTVIEGAFAGASFDPRQVRVSLADGRVVTAPLLVGAEGRRSRVRDAAAIKTMGWPYRQTGVVATVKLDRPHLGVAHEIFLPGGPLAVLPLTGQRASLVWTESSAQAQALTSVPREAFEAHLYRRFGEQLGRPELLGSRAAFPLALQMADRMTADRVALVGDAAHAIHPIAGQGLNLGLKDAAALAEVIVDAHRLGEDWGSSLVLDRYVRWRRFDAAALAAATDLFNRLFSNDDPLLRAVRGAGLALVEQSRPLKRFFVREASGASGDLPRLLRGEAL